MLKFILLAFILCGVYLVFLFSEKKKMHALEKSLTPLVDELSTLDKVVEGQLNTFKDTQKKIENLLTAKGPDFELTSQKIEALNRKIEAQCLAKKKKLDWTANDQLSDIVEFIRNERQDIYSSTLDTPLALQHIKSLSSVGDPRVVFYFEYPNRNVLEKQDFEEALSEIQEYYVKVEKGRDLNDLFFDDPFSQYWVSQFPGPSSLVPKGSL